MKGNFLHGISMSFHKKHICVHCLVILSAVEFCLEVLKKIKLSFLMFVRFIVSDNISVTKTPPGVCSQLL